MPDKQLTNNDQTFADSWKLDRSCPNAPPLPNPCTIAGAHAQVAKAKCALMRSQPFSACHNHVKVDSGFIQDCEYDVCACKDHPLSCLCEEYSAYADSCSLVGVSFQWKHLPQFKECGKTIHLQSNNIIRVCTTMLELTVHLRSYIVEVRLHIVVHNSSSGV